jgi:tRNA (uracil-5-)-methyltransferase
MRPLLPLTPVFKRAGRGSSALYPNPYMIWLIMPGKTNQRGYGVKRQKKESKSNLVEGSHEEVLLNDVRRLLAAHSVIDTAGQNVLSLEQNSSPYVPLERFSEVEVRISELSSTGDGLGLSSTSDHVYVVPFTLPGDVVRAKAVHYFAQERYTLTDFVQIVLPSQQRDDTLVRCPYFSRCSGCQFQMLSYVDQLIHKRSIIVKAYENFSNLIPELVPLVGETIGSPLQYGYRTKLTPHFDGPPGSLRKNKKGRFNGVERKGFDAMPPIGFMLKGTRKTIDIEDCPIGTEVVRSGMVGERKRVATMLATFKKGATLLLRESTTRSPDAEPSTGLTGLDSEKETNLENLNGLEQKSLPVANEPDAGHGKPNSISYKEVKTCVTDSNAVSTEYVDNFKFSNPAGAFFQNNNSILPRFTAYIRNHILPKNDKEHALPVKYLIDAYCGSGLFTITLASLFSSSIGIDIAMGSIISARENAIQNHVANASFITADASALFKEVLYSPDETVVIIDPPRKGCDGAFLQQLMRFSPIRVVYVSCNVHTQARDVGVLVQGTKECQYEIESLRGFDFFPQTSHVEGIAILCRSPNVA